MNPDQLDDMVNDAVAKINLEDGKCSCGKVFDEENIPYCFVSVDKKILAFSCSKECTADILRLTKWHGNRVVRAISELGDFER